MNEIIIELFLLDNFLMTYLIILTAKEIAGKRTRAWGVAVACAICSAISAFAMIEQWMQTIPVKTVLLCIITFASFYIDSLRAFIKCSLSVLVSTFLLGGIVYALTLASGGSFWGGAIYANNVLRLWIIGFTSCLFVPRLIKRFVIFKNAQAGEVTLRLSTEYGAATVQAFVDTGNSLREPVSLLPVIIADREELNTLFPTEWAENWQEHPVHGMRLVPYKALGGDGILPAIKTKGVKRLNGGRFIDGAQCYLAAGNLQGHKVIVNSDWLNIT